MSKITQSAITVSHRRHQIPVIYMIRNTVNGKIYIGQTVNLYKRYKSHERSEKNKDAYRRPIVSAFKKYGFSYFEFLILEEMTRDTNLLTEREQYWMDRYQSYKRSVGYNACAAAGSTLGFKHTEETRRKVSIASTGRRASLETRLKMSKVQSGKHMSEQTREKISIAKTGVKHGNTRGRSVIQLGAGQAAIETYKSITVAHIETGVHLSNIARACKKGSTAGGFHWRYA